MFLFPEAAEDVVRQYGRSESEAHLLGIDRIETDVQQEGFRWPVQVTSTRDSSPQWRKAVLYPCDPTPGRELVFEHEKASTGFQHSGEFGSGDLRRLDGAHSER